LAELTVKEAEECGLIYTRHVDANRATILFPDYILLSIELDKLKPGTVIGKPKYDKLLLEVSRLVILFGKAT